jgi:hypothetical protein
MLSIVVLYVVILSAFLQGVVMLNASHYAECCYAECRYAEYRYAVLFC